MQTNLKIIGRRFRESCDELFESAYIAGRVIDRPPPVDPARRQIGSVVGFGGWQIRGSLSVRAGVEFFLETHPSFKHKADCPEPDLLDWAGEMTNLALGRFKNNMLPHGLDFQVTVPVSILRGNMMDADAQRDASFDYHFRTPHNAVSIGVSFNLAPGVTVMETPGGKVALRPGKPIDL